MDYDTIAKDANEQGKVVHICLVIINDETNLFKYSILTNLHADWGLCSRAMSSLHSNSSKKYRRRLASIRGKKKFIGTNNSLGCTRLVYTVHSDFK